jgi:hypothetical protein
MKCAALAAAVLFAGPAQANFRISDRVSSEVRCAANVCTATGPRANFFYGTLTSMLATADVTLVGTWRAKNIQVLRPLSWSSTHTLTLRSYRSVEILKPVSNTSTGGLAIETNQGGSGGVFTFGHAGKVHFWDVAGSFTLNGAAHMLVDGVPALAAAIQDDPTGNYALAGDYNAGPDGSYITNPVIATYNGHFEGLGNTISHLTIRGNHAKFGLFRTIGAPSVVENLSLTKMRIHATGLRGATGGLVYENFGTVRNVYVQGKVSATGLQAITGAIAAINHGAIERSSANNVPQNGTECGGGLVGTNDGTITESFAIGKMFSAQSGGIACLNTGTISNSYSIVEVGGRFPTPYPGGIASLNAGAISKSYAAGQITAASNFGAIAGTNNGTLTQDYWDEDYTGADVGFGCGSGSCAGATGLTHEQITGALPAGFDPAIWGLDANVNGGWPYLLDNPPR